MKAPSPKHERIGSQSTICVFCLLGILISSMSLGSMRLYGLYLEHRLADVTRRIEVINSGNSGMEEQYSALLSPSRIYNYARVQLNMTVAKDVETIKIRDRGEESVKLAGAREIDTSPGGFFGFFVGRANAKD